MTNINDELGDMLKNGAGDRTNDQITILKAYAIVASDISMDNVFIITNKMEDAYNNLK
jgi:hypothetical protein